MNNREKHNKSNPKLQKWVTGKLLQAGNHRLQLALMFGKTEKTLIQWLIKDNTMLCSYYSLERIAELLSLPPHADHNTLVEERKEI